MRLVITGQDGGSREITQLVGTVEFSGDQKQAARSLTFTLLSSPGDASLPEVDCALGSGVTLQADGAVFSGYVYSRTRNTEESVIQVHCFDRGFSLKRIETAKKFVDTTPEAAAAQLCGEFGIPMGSLEATGVPLTRNLIGVSLYDMIATLYTMASERTGKQYRLAFTGENFEVWEIGKRVSPIVIRGETNLIGATVTESVEEMVNSVVIHDDAGNVLSQVQNQAYIRLFGLLQKTLRQTKEDLGPKAQELLETNGIRQKITLQNWGDASLVTGVAVTVREPTTGLFGRFFILSDTHTWKKNLYCNRLVVDYKMTMDKQNAGTAPGNGSGSAPAQEYRYTPKGE